MEHYFATKIIHPFTRLQELLGDTDKFSADLRESHLPMYISHLMNAVNGQNQFG